MIIHDSPSILFTAMNISNKICYIIFYDHKSETLYLHIVNLKKTISITNNAHMPSMDIMGNTIAISFYNPSMKALMFIISSDNGQKWSDPIIVDNSKDVGINSCLKIINKVPVISYYSFDERTLYIVTAKNSNYFKWNKPIKIDDTNNDVGLYSSLIIINDIPMITYYDADYRQLKFISSINLTCNKWIKPIIIDNEGTVGLYVKLFETEGYPTVIYFDNETQSLKYSRLLNKNGTSWCKPLTLDILGNVGRDISVTLINNMPTIVYSEVLKNKTLKMMQAKDKIGSSWEHPIILDNCQGNKRELVDKNNLIITEKDDHFPGMYTVICEYNGHAIICYRNSITGSLQLIYH